MSKRLARPEVDREQTWDLESIYPTAAAWEADLTRVDGLLPALGAYQGRLGSDAATLLACLSDYFAGFELAEQVLSFASHICNADQTDPAAQSNRGRALAMMARFEAATAFIQPEILGLPESALAQFLDAEPALAPYRHYLSDILAERAHMLGTEAEAVVAALGELAQAPYVIWQNTTAGDMTFDPVTEEHGNVVPMSMAALFRLLQSPDRTVRQAAYESASRALLAHKRTIAAAATSAVRRDAVLAKLRRYPSSLHAALAEEHLPAELYTNLLAASEAGAVHLRRYNEFRRRQLGVDTLQAWDLSAPLDVSIDTSITFADARSLILAALEPLGAEYRLVLEQAFEERWIDFADNEGKVSGAYCAPFYRHHPVVLLTWQGRLSNAFTLVHELGHAVHAVLAARAQPYQYARFSIFLAEMASTANELLLARHLLRTSQDRKVRRYVLSQALGTFVNNFWGGSMGAALQLWMHEAAEQNQPLTYESITAAQVDICRRWYGDSVAVTPEGLGAMWMRMPHNFLNFYAYQYATGISGAAAFAEAILTGGAPAVERYLGFLRAGVSAHPADILHTAGLDMRTGAPVEAAVTYFGQLVTELERT
jgi:oligoendopeptidase F